MSTSGTVAARVELRVLGPLEVEVEGRPVAIVGAQRRRLLAGLLTRPGEIVSPDRLAELLWGGRVPGDAANALSTAVSRLRRDLGLAAADAGAPVRIERRPDGYALVVPDGCVDATRFEALVDAVRDSGCAPQEAAPRLAAALDLWRGRAFGELADEPLVRAEAQRLEERRRTATEDLFDAALASGRHREIVGEVRAFADAHPLRERPRGQLMLALHRSGRQAEALAAYRSFRDRVDRDLGLVPSAALQQLERAILRDADELRIPRAGAHQGAETGASPLPRPPSRLVARDDEVADISERLAEHRVVTLVGVGGVGKTRLAVAAASGLEPRYADGVVWCALDETEAPSVAAALATAVGARPGPDRSPASSLLESLRSVAVLLVVDNCEHVVNVVGPLLESLLRGCPEVAVLATSRERLAVDGEHVVPVEPLAVPAATDDPAALAEVPSVRLLLERARAVVPGFAVTADNARAVAALCTRLDGVPLALELAAARLRSMSAGEVVDRLDARLRLLAADRRTAGGRHQTLQAVAAWSYDLLTAPERLVFDRVSVFAGGFALDAAEAVAAGGQVESDDVAGLLAALVDKSMVARDWSGSDRRYRLLEFLRRFGRVRLERQDDAEAPRGRHATWFLAAAEQNEALLSGPAEARAVDAIDRDLANLRVAHRWLLSAGHVGDAVRLWAALAPYTVFRLSDEVLAWAEDVLAAPGAQTSARAPVATAMAAACLANAGRRHEATRLVEVGLRHVAPGNPAARHGVLVRGLLALYEGRLADCLRDSEDSRRLATAVDDRAWAAFSALHEVLALAYDGDVERAAQRADVHRRLAESTGNPTQIAWSLYARGEVLATADPGRALAVLEEAVDLARSVRNVLAEGVALLSTTSLRARQGPPQEALRSFEDVIGRWRRSGGWTQQWTTLRNLAELLARIGRDRPAAVLLAATRAADTAAPAFGRQAQRLAALETVVARRLGGGPWEAAVARAATLDAEAVVDFALEEIAAARASARR